MAKQLRAAPKMGAIKRLTYLALLGLVGVNATEQVEQKQEILTEQQDAPRRQLHSQSRQFHYRVRQVFPYVDAQASWDGLAWRYAYGDGSSATAEEYDTWAAYQAFIWSGGDEPRLQTPEYEEGDTEDDYIYEEYYEESGSIDAGDFVYMGCMNDCFDGDNSRGGFAMTRKIGHNLHPTDCMNEGNLEGFEFIGMTREAQCYAINDIDSSWYVEEAWCDQPCRHDDSQWCGSSNSCYKSVWSVAGSADECAAGQYRENGYCYDMNPCDEWLVQDEDGNCWDNEQEWATEELMTEGSMTFDAIRRYNEIMYEVYDLENELREVRLNTDFSMDPECGMHSARGPTGSCDMCPEDWVQDDFGGSCMKTGEHETINDDYDREVFYGTSYNGVYEGRGEYRWANGDRYIGDFRYSLPEGYGKKVFSSGNVYEGDFREGRMEPWGSFMYTSGRMYHGEFSDGTFEGMGSIFWPDGTFIDGMFSNDEVNGYATKWYPDGAMYEGEWVNGFEQGYGTFTSADGEVWSGTWTAGQRD